MEKLMLLGEAVIIGTLYLLWKEFMATKGDILLRIQTNQTVQLQKISEVQAGIDALIAQGGGSDTAALDEIDAAVDASNTAVSGAIDALKTKLPGNEI